MIVSWEMYELQNERQNIGQPRNQTTRQLMVTAGGKW